MLKLAGCAHVLYLCIPPSLYQAQHTACLSREHEIHLHGIQHTIFTVLQTVLHTDGSRALISKNQSAPNEQGYSEFVPQLERQQQERRGSNKPSSNQAYIGVAHTI
jgi:hypothetical protein